MEFLQLMARQQKESHQVEEESLETLQIQAGIALAQVVLSSHYSYPPVQDLIQE
jgi:hypothetical protein